MSHRQLILLPLLCCSLALASCGRTRGGGSGDDDDDGPGTPSGPLVKGLAIEGIALYQGVRIDLVDGEDVVIDEKPVDVIAGRDAMLRVFVNPGSNWDSRSVSAVVEIDVDGDGDIETFSAEQNISDATSDNSLSNSLNVDIPGEFMTRDAGLVSVTLLEVEDDVDAEGNSGGAEWTADGDFLDLNARDTGPSVRIVLVPVEYNGDGSGRFPDLSEGQLQIYRDHLYAQYPTREVELIVEDPLTVNYQISPFGAGWGELLQSIGGRRDSDGAAFEEYYYGLFSPASSFEQFCQQGCVAGLSSLVQSPGDDWSRVSMGLGFSGEGSAETMVHEIGHAHGREHAPCEVNDAGYYPHSGADIGVQGYDLRGGSLKNPGSFTDFMGYCNPTWVSDYTYNWLFDRITAVNASADFVAGPGFTPEFSSVRVDMDGSLARGRDMKLRMAPQGEMRTLEMLDMDGELLHTVEASFHPYSHLDGGQILFPTPGENVASLRLPSGQTLLW